MKNNDLALDFGDFIVLPSFPTNIVVFNLKEDYSKLLEEIKINTEWSDVYNETSADSNRTVDLKLLNRFPEFYKSFLLQFNKFKNQILRLEDVEFAISSSWGTRTKENGFCQYHLHANSYYSGVFYFQDVVEGGELEFENPSSNRGGFSAEPVEWNYFNYEIYKIKPKKNMLLFFPSILRHKINKVKDVGDRYSLAFNLIPVGQFGRGDSALDINLNH
jgi:uncharacterized protein (TIGR02466 family)